VFGAEEEEEKQATLSDETCTLTLTWKLNENSLKQLQTSSKVINYSATDITLIQ